MGKLRITVVEARNLTDKDTFSGNILFKYKGNDAYVKITVGSTTKKTSVKNNTGSKAVWNEALEFDIKDKVNKAEVKVLDKDMLIDDTIGKIKVMLDSAFMFGSHEQWYYIGKDKVNQGEVRLIIEFWK